MISMFLFIRNKRKAIETEISLNERPQWLLNYTDGQFDIFPVVFELVKLTERAWIRSTIFRSVQLLFGRFILTLTLSELSVQPNVFIHNQTFLFKHFIVYMQPKYTWLEVKLGFNLRNKFYSLLHFLWYSPSKEKFCIVNSLLLFVESPCRIFPRNRKKATFSKDC